LGAVLSIKYGEWGRDKDDGDDALSEPPCGAQPRR